ncbi:MAG: S9 family peptidase [Candidatus Krumholzibacteria bacterium]|nr:S9 family peptidase [Candidatus Krumholzibacteria bacterium]
MRKVLLALAVVCLTASAAPAEQLDYLDKLPPIIDREIFFGDPEIAGAQISPDGSYISFLKDYRGKLNIWVKGIDEPFDEARPLSADTVRNVRGYGWSEDGRYIVYVQDKGGDENFHLYVIDPAGAVEPATGVPAARDLSPIDGIRAIPYAFPEKTPDIIYLGLNDRDERYHDLYRIRLSTGERELIFENTEGYAGYDFDLDGNLRLLSKTTDDGGTEYFRIDGDEITSIIRSTNEENVGVIRFHKDGERVYLDTNIGEDVDLSRLTLFNVETGEETLVESDPKKEVDFGGTTFSDATDELVATYYVGDRLRIYWHDKKFEKAYKELRKKLPEGDLYFGSGTEDDRLVLVTVTSDVDPGAAYLYNMQTGELEFLYRPRPNLPVEHLAQMKPVSYKTRDGLTVHGYLTVPKGVKAKNLPVVINPHGGPWARDMWGYNPEVQYLANRGYAVFQPNFRASTGYGKAFFNAGKKQWGFAMQNDITDGVNFLVKEGIADPEKVAIYGGSYGGYATLAGLAFTPDLYACGISYVGVSNMLTFLKSIPAYWETARKFLNEHVGDPDNPEDIERLRQQSPLFSADKITAPLLVAQGANDPRVVKAESDQIVVAMRDLGREVEYMVAPDEGHGFLNEENRVAMYVAMERFFARHLGGRYQEDVRPEIQAKFDAISVPVASVTVKEPEGDLEAAMTSPLPAVKGDILKPAKLTYKALASVQGMEIPLDVTVTLSRTTWEGAPAWSTISSQSSMMGSAVDTFIIGAADLLPLYRGLTQGPATVSMKYDEGGVKGVINMGAQSMPVDTPLEAPVYGDGTALDMVLASLPLAPGYKTPLRYFDLLSQQVRIDVVEVTGVESVTVPAGTYEVFKIETRPMGNEPGGGTYFVDTMSRHLVRATVQLPPMSGGGSVTSELTAIE